MAGVKYAAGRRGSSSVNHRTNRKPIHSRDNQLEAKQLLQPRENLLKKNQSELTKNIDSWKATTCDIKRIGEDFLFKWMQKVGDSRVMRFHPEAAYKLARNVKISEFSSEFELYEGVGVGE
jgi:hypothetical protein